jgi:hypothetical protein
MCTRREGTYVCSWSISVHAIYGSTQLLCAYLNDYSLEGIRAPGTVLLLKDTLAKLKAI